MIEKIQVNEKETFGKLTYVGHDAEPKKKSTGGRNAQEIPIGYLYHLVSELQYDVDVLLPMGTTKTAFDFQTPIELKNPSVCPVGVRTNNGTYVQWEAFADGINKL